MAAHKLISLSAAASEKCIRFSLSCRLLRLRIGLVWVGLDWSGVKWSGRVVWAVVQFPAVCENRFGAIKPLTEAVSLFERCGFALGVR